MMDIWAFSTFWLSLNDAAVNILVQVSVWTYVFISLVYMPRSRIAGLFKDKKCWTLVNMVRTYGSQ